MSVLVLNCYSRNALAVINGLDPSIELIGASERKNSFFVTDPSRFFRSSRLSRVLRYASPAKDPDQFVEDIVQICAEHQIKGIIPTGTNLTNALSQYKKVIEEKTGAKCAVEDYELLEKVTDKWHTFELCRDAGVRTPKTVLFDYKEKHLSKLDELPFPIIVKPRVSYASIGLRFFDTAQEIRNFVIENPSDHAEGEFPYVAQERIDGSLHDVTCCSQSGKSKAMLTQQRVVSLYDFGGGGIINLTTREEGAMNLAKSFLGHTGWSGVLVFDFIRAENGDFYLLECNPKIWGTTDLTIRSGLNVAQMIYDIFVLEKDVPEIQSYEDGVLYRWWFPEILFHWAHAPRSLSKIKTRMANTFKNYGEKRSMSNLRSGDLRHLLGIVFDRTKL